MRSFDHHPASLSDVLNTLAGRLRKVDLRLIDEIRQLWPDVVDPVVAEHCRPDFIKNGVLVISVPSGAYAQRVQLESATILAGFGSLGSRAPTSLRTILRTS